MNYANIKPIDSVDGEGIRVSLFVSGCHFHCSGCQNVEQWDYKCGTKFTNETQKLINSLLTKSYISGFSILGGEPLDPKNRKTVFEIIENTRRYLDETGILTCNKTIWLWTGYTYEYLIENNIIPRKILEKIDVIVDGLFYIAQRDITLKFRGSRNQRVIDVKKSLELNNVVCWCE